MSHSDKGERKGHCREKRKRKKENEAPRAEKMWKEDYFAEM